jgi:membrane protease YdiL (CAAX protease family)
MPPFPPQVIADSPHAPAPRGRSPLRFFLVVVALSIPFAWLGAVTDLQLYPGIPVSALAFVCPVSAAALLSYRENGAAAVSALLRRAFDFRRIRAKVWYLPTVLLMPGVTVVAYGLMRALRSPLPTPLFPGSGAFVLFLAFLVAALGEELGWSGYALDPMQERWSALQASLVLGVVWALWHVVAMVEAGQSPAWIAWGCLDMLGTRVLMVWLYNNTGKSVFAVALYHAIANLSVKSMFPGGSYEAERIIAVILAGAAVIVTIVCGRTLGMLVTTSRARP